MSDLSESRSLEAAEDGRERRSEETREALIKAGLELFGDNGVQGTTSRMLAAAAQSNIAAINYHFGSKEGLYLAVVTSIAERMDQHFSGIDRTDPALLDPSQLSATAAIQTFSKMVDHLAGLMVDSDEVRSWARIIVREQSKPTLAFDVLYRDRMEFHQKLLARLTGAALGTDPESAEIKIRVHALIGQVLAFATSRESLLRSLEVPRLSAAHCQLVRDILREHVEACLSISLPKPLSA
ncbi:MAG: transcriptional regulator CecR [Synoicihabitans sp.]